jgi:hypothetical protein
LGRRLGKVQVVVRTRIKIKISVAGKSVVAQWDGPDVLDPFTGES